MPIEPPAAADWPSRQKGEGIRDRGVRMHLGFVVFEGMTALDFMGMYDPLTRLGTMGFRDDIEWSVCARHDPVHAKAGVGIAPDVTPESLQGYEVVLVPGGIGDGSILEDEGFIDWLATGQQADLIASVCTGALLLGAAGLLDGRRAATHPGSRNALSQHATVVDERIVDEGDLVTAGGVTASVDLGLYLVERLADASIREAIATQMDYPYGPFGSGAEPSAEA